MTKDDRRILSDIAGGKPISAIAGDIVNGLHPDIQIEAAKKATGLAEPPPEAIQKTAESLLADAAKALVANPALRHKMLELKKSYEQTIDNVSKDTVLEAAFSAEAKDKAKSIVQSFEQFIREHKDEITALQILYSRRSTLTRGRPIGLPFDLAFRIPALSASCLALGSCRRTKCNSTSL